MQQFTVPQFIDVEDKIIGPITARQFVIMLLGFMLIILWYQIFRFTPFIIISLFTFGVHGLFAFFKVNGMAFHYFVLNITHTAMRPGLRIWNNSYGKKEPSVEDEKKADEFMPSAKKPLSQSRLAELSLIVDTRGAYKGGGISHHDEANQLEERAEKVDN